MKAWIVVLGFIILLSGLVILNVSGASKIETETVAQGRGIWEVRGFFRKGDKLIVKYTQGANWRLGSYFGRWEFPEAAAFETKMLMVTVTHEESGNKTDFVVILTPTGKKGESPLLAVRIWVDEGANESLILESKPENLTGVFKYYLDEISGFAKYDGYYTARIEGIMFPPPYETDPPVWLGLIRERKVQPYTQFFPFGVAVVLAGLVVLGFGLLKREKERG